MFSSRANPTPKRSAHCVIVHVPLSGSSLGSDDERTAIHRMCRLLETQLASSGAGEFDGDEFGDGLCRLFMYGPSADELFGSIFPILNGWRPLRGGFAIKRYGPPGARSQRVDF